MHDAGKREDGLGVVPRVERLEHIGAAEKGEDEKTLLERIAEIEEEIGDISELGEEFENLVKAILGESARAQKAEKELSDAIGVPTIEPDEDGDLYDFHFRFKEDYGIWKEKCGTYPPTLCADFNDWGDYDSKIIYFGFKI